MDSESKCRNIILACLGKPSSRVNLLMRLGESHAGSEGMQSLTKFRNASTNGVVARGRTSLASCCFPGARGPFLKTNSFSVIKCPGSFLRFFTGPFVLESGNPEIFDIFLQMTGSSEAVITTSSEVSLLIFMEEKRDRNDNGRNSRH